MNKTQMAEVCYQNYLTKTIAQIDDCLFIYMEFKAIGHAL